jgi:hypothetical protein
MFLMDLSLHGDRYALADPMLATTFRRKSISMDSRGITMASAPSVVVALLAAMFVDVFGYSYHSGLPDNKIADSYRSPAIDYWLLADTASPYYDVGRVQRLKWQAERLDTPTEARQQLALDLPSYYHTYAFAQFDPCEPTIKAPTILNTSIAKLLSLRDKGDGALRTILGCHAPKMRLVRDARYVADDKAAALAVQGASGLAGTVFVWNSAEPRRSQ